MKSIIMLMKKINKNKKNNITNKILMKLQISLSVKSCTNNKVKYHNNITS